MKSRLGVALIGPGRIAPAHLVAIRAAGDIAELVAVAGLPEEEERTRSLAQEFGARKALVGLDSVLEDPDIDAVVLTVPNHLHSQLALLAMEAGKHVLVEKPLANTLADADDMISASKRCGRILMVGQCRRFFRGVREARERIAEIGHPVNIIHILGVHWDEVQTAWWRSAATTGGLVLGLNGPHVIDTILWLIGERPTSVYARTARFKPVWEGEDEATFTLSFPSGSMASGHLSFNMKPEVNERWIVGPLGTMRLSNDRNLWVNDQQVVQEDFRTYLEGDSGFVNQFREFGTSILEGRQPVASAEEVRPVIEVLEAARLSAREQSVVELSSEAL